MDVRSPFFQNIALIVAGVMFLNPIVASAAQLTVDAQAGGNTTIGQAQNGVPVVNIATPNGSGLSHNKFTDYNVGQQGLILNNGAQAFVKSQQGGYINGNPNLKGGAAGVILNEVTGSNRSQLKGYTEVAGSRAHVIVANPHGITCDGCGFINTPRATLTTGAPVVDNGRLQRFDVNGGDIAIEGAGLNASNVDQFDLITRSAQINAEIHAKRLNVIAGRNEVDVATLQATAKADDGSSQPQLAIDSSALGGMYAGAIRLVGTEAGVGVKLAGDMAASAGDIQIDANGQLTTNRMAASNDVTLVAKGAELNADTYAGRNATVTSPGTVQVKESLAAGQRVAVQATQLDNAGIIEAGVRADGSVSSAGHLQLDGGTVRNAGKLTSHGSLSTDLQKLDNQGAAITAAGNTTLKAEQLDNRNGEIVAQGSLTLDSQKVDNKQGRAVAGQVLAIKAESADNSAGTVAAGGAIEVEVAERLDNASGLIEAGSQVTVKAQEVDNRSGQIRALGNAGASQFEVADKLNNDGGKIEVGNAGLAIESGSLTNQGGLIRHLGSQNLGMTMEQLGQAGGRIETNAQLDLQADEWVNTTELQAGRISLDIGELTQKTGAALLSRDSIVAKGDTWQNDGRIETNGNLSLELAGDYKGNGTLIAQGNLGFSAASADMGTNAKVLAGGTSNLSTLGAWVARGQMTAGSWLTLAAQSLKNYGTIGAGNQLSLKAADIRSEDGFLFSGASMLLVADHFTNQRGDVYSVGDLQFVANEQGDAPTSFSNLSGVVESEGNIAIRAKQITNAHEVENLVVSRKVAALFYAPDCTDCSGNKENVRYRLKQIDRTQAVSDVRTASLLAGGNLTLDGQDIHNRFSMLAANGAVRIKGDTFTSVGAETGEYVSEGRATSEREKKQGWIHDAVHGFNARNWPTASTNVEADLNSILTQVLKGSFEHFSTTYTPDAVQAYAAIVQSGDANGVTIEARQIGNASIRPSFNFVNGGTRADTSTPGTDIATSITLNPQLPPDLQQKAVDPLALPGFSLPAGQNGLFSLSNNPGHPYLIETNPAFANLGRFLNSDYMLGLLGYDPDEMQRRLGDGFYEQRLVRDAVRARTGQRFLAGLDSDEAQFKYLMDNAIASKEALQLSVGIGLSAEQVAALTHDIVWMEEREVSGQKVLVPVVYLAQAEGRLAPGGALIQGRDVALISGSNLVNSGTLRATQDLTLTAQQNIANSGLMHADGRLSLLAGESIRNSQGGILKGQDVSLVAVAGDVVNERTISTHHSTTRHTDRQQSFVDSAARIEAVNDLQVSAGNDIRNIGGAISAGRDASLEAGNDLILGSAEAENRQNKWDRKGHSYQNSITQYGSDVQIGRDLEASAGRDLLVVGSKVKAGGDIDLSSAGDMTIASAANESAYDYRHKGGSKRVHNEERQVRQQASVIESGKDLNVVAGNDLALVASQLRAGDEAYLYAGNNLALLTAEDSNYSFFEKHKKSFTSKKSSLDERTQITNVGSSVTSNGDAVLIAKNDLGVMGSSVESTKADVSLLAGNDVQIGSVSDLNESRQSRSSSKSSWGGFKSSKAKNDVSESSTQSVGSLISGDNVSIQSGRDAQVTGSGVVGTHDVELIATRDLKVDAATNTFSRDERYKVKSHDFTGILTANNLGLDDITGKQRLSISNGKGSSSAQETTLSGSTIGSSEGNLTLSAGRKLDVVASDLVSTKDLSLTGSDVTIAAGIETAKQSSKDSSQSLAVGRVVGGSVIDAAKSIYYDAKAARDADDDRLRAVKAAQAVMSAYSLTQQGSTAAANISDGKPANSSGSLIKIGTEVALTNKKSSSEYSSELVKQSNLNAGGMLSIVATGEDPSSQGDINVIGSNLKAAETELIAKRNITLESAQNRSEWNNKDTTNRTAVGASFNIGQQNGFTLDLGASVGKALGKGYELTQVNSQLDTGSLLLISGKDTTLAGAQVHADKVQAAIGGDLNIVSRQDEASTSQSQKNGGFGASLCIPPFCYGATVSGSASLGGGKTSTDYKAVTEQSGIYAGKGGYDITVGDTTRLQGAVIASDATADKNRLSTERLEHSDIRNRSEIKSQSASLSVSYSSSGETKGGDGVKAESALGGGLPLALKESERSTTRSAISEGTIEVRSADGVSDLNGLSRDTVGANQRLDRPDEKAMRERMDLIQSTAALGQSVVSVISQAKQKEAQDKLKQAEKSGSPADLTAARIAMAEARRWEVGGDKRIFANITTGLLAAGLGGTGAGTTAGIVANTTAADTFKKIGDYADNQSKTATDEATKAAWAEGGIARILLHATAGAIQGLAGGSIESGAVGAGLSASVMPAIAKALEGSGLSESDRDVVATLIATGIGTGAGSGGGIAGQVIAGGSAGNVDLFNRQLHAAELKAIEVEADRLTRETGSTVSSSGVTWEDLLLLAAGAELDAAEDARLSSIVAKYGEGNPEADTFARDFVVAAEIIQKLASQNIPLTWSDKKPIVAHGEMVYAFQATDAQYNDSGLFNKNAPYQSPQSSIWLGDELVPELWKQQFGEREAVRYLNEILRSSTNQAEFDYAVERLSTVVSGGITDLTAETVEAGMALHGAGKTLLAARTLLAKRVAERTVKNYNPTSGKTDSEAAQSELPKIWDIPDTTISKFPEGWAVSPNKKGVGFRWQDPNNKGNGVRIDKGEPDISQKTQQVDHVIVRYNGKVIGRDGKPVSGSIKDHAEEVHIPLNEYRKWKNWYSPN